MLAVFSLDGAHDGANQNRFRHSQEALQIDADCLRDCTSGDYFIHTSSEYRIRNVHSYRRGKRGTPRCLTGRAETASDQVSIDIMA